MKKVLAIATASLLPALALAQNVSYITNWINYIKDIINSLVPIIIALAVVYFLWNAFQYIKTDDAKTKQESGVKMLWGIVFLAGMVSIWGLVALLQNIFGVGKQGAGSVTDLIPR